MATSVNWETHVITVPKADMPVIQVSPEIREFDVAQFHLDLRTLQASELGADESTTHLHDTERTLSGTVYARFIVILDYTVEFEATGGNYSVACVGANHNIADVQVQNGVGIIVTNSAGLTNVKQAQAMLYNGEVSIDFVNGTPGFTGLKGTPNDPVDNLTDALLIAERINSRTFNLRAGTLTLTQDLTYWTFKGRGLGIVDVNGFDVDGSEFYDLELTGDLGGTGMIESFGCQLRAVTGVQGKHFSTGLYYDAVQDVVLSGNTVFQDSRSYAPGPSVQPGVSMGGLNITAEFRGHMGGLRLKDSTHASSLFSIDAPSASVVLDASCTATGGGVIRGKGNLTRNDSMGLSVNDDGFEVHGGSTG